MCTSPRSLRVLNPAYNPKNYTMPASYKPASINYQKLRDKFTFPASENMHYFQEPRVRDIVVGCGKCRECLNKRQNSHQLRVYEEMKKHPFVAHQTLTYADQNMPFIASFEYLQLEYVDELTGEYIPEYWERSTEQIFLEDSPVLDEIRAIYHRRKDKRSPFKYVMDDLPHSASGLQCRVIITPSVHRWTVREAIKVCRILFKRAKGHLAKFSYTFCTEFGPNTLRPHNHILWMFDDKSDFYAWLSMFNIYWSKKYGYVCEKIVPRINPDKSDAYFLASKYLSKYFSKGEFEYSLCRDGYTEKTRVCNSKFLGNTLSSSYHLAFDLFGEYDRNSLRLTRSGRRLTDSELRVVVDEIIKRFQVKVSPQSKHFIQLPKYFKDKFFTYKDSSYPFTKQIRRYKISFLVSRRLRELFLEREYKRLDRQKLFVESERISISALAKSANATAEFRDARAQENYKKWLQRSIA